MQNHNKNSAAKCEHCLAMGSVSSVKPAVGLSQLRTEIETERECCEILKRDENYDKMQEGSHCEQREPVSPSSSKGH